VRRSIASFFAKRKAARRALPDTGAMFERIVATAKGCAAGLVLALNTIVLTLAMLPFALAKLLVPASGVRRAVDRVLNAIARAWIAVNNAWMTAVGRTRWDVQVPDALKPHGWYLVSSNHASWVDILVLQRVFSGRIPLLKFFLKQELIWVPVIGLAWWALDFPFLKRGRGGASGQTDLAATRRACERFKLIPTSVIIFAEGTRFTRAKHALQRSPYRHLLKPKSGGLAIALATMGGRLDALLDVTIFYPGSTPTFWDLLCGRVHEVVVRAQLRPIPPQLFSAAVAASPRFRAHVQRWIDALWQDKDRLLDELASTRPVTGSG
jgi:1-acyl-sn-glycerol-3-phosphate acyltransferase